MIMKEHNKKKILDKETLDKETNTDIHGLYNRSCWVGRQESGRSGGRALGVFTFCLLIISIDMLFFLTFRNMEY